MKKKIDFFHFSLIFLVILSLIDFCYLKNNKDQNYRWSVIHLQINWELNKNPRWYMGPLLAKEIFTPIIISHDSDLKLWRFHRRASRDYSGHQFSFIFFAKEKIAKKIFREIKGSPLFNELIQKKYIVRANFICSKKMKKEDFSDPSWDIEMQKAWPEYAMGLSKLWLQLVLLYDQKLGKEKNIVEHYKKIEKKLEKEWKRDFPHALLHHAHAMFAYVL